MQIKITLVDIFTPTPNYDISPDRKSFLMMQFVEEPKTIDRITPRLKLTFEAERPPPPHQLQQELLMAAEEMG